MATTNGTEESFTYDEVGNLVTDTVTDTGTTTFTYDSANRLARSDCTAATDGAATVTTYYGWDAANAWRTSRGPQADPGARPVQMSYNALGRMSAYANADANTSAAYTYDAAGQRTKKEVTVAGTQTTTTYAYEGLTLMKLSAVQASTSWRIDYLCDEEGALWGGVYRSPAGSTSPTFFSVITTDHGDVVELCDADGAPFAAYRYDAWGLPQGAGSYATGMWTQSTTLVNATLAGQIASRQVLRYASYAWDAESSLYYCSARYYDPATRQWTTGDPAKADGEESAYQYCGGNPAENVDPTGLGAYIKTWRMSHHHFVLVTGGVLWDNHPEIRSNKSKWEMFAQADYDVTQAHGHFPKWLVYQFWFKILNVTPNIFRTDYTKVLLQKRTGTSSWEKVGKYETDAEVWVTNATPDAVSVDKVWWPDINTSVKKTYYSSTEDRRVNGSRFLVRYRMWSIYGGMRGYWKCKLAMPRTRAEAKDADARSGGWLGPTED